MLRYRVIKKMSSKLVNNLSTKSGLITGGELVYSSLVRNSVKDVVIYSGGAIMPVVDAFYDKTNINYYIPTNEQNGGHISTGYSKTSEKCGVAIVTSGPGLTNLVTPILDATNDSTPLIVISGQVSLKTMGTNAFQECPATDITKSVTKWSYCIQNVQEVSRVIDLAFKIANDGKKGTVHIDIPKCVSSSIYEYDENYSLEHLDKIEKDKVYGIKDKAITEHFQIKDIANIINNSEKPILYVGKGCNDYSYLLKLLVEKANIPVTTTLHGLGIFDETHPLSLKMVGMHGSAYSNFAIQESDCVIALGSRFDDRTIGNIDKYAPKAKGNIIQVNIDSNDIGKTIKPDIEILADCGLFLEYIIPHININKRENWTNRVKELKEEYPFKYNKADNNKIKPQSVLIEMNKQLNTQEQPIFTMGVGNHMMMSCQFIDWRKPKQIVASGSLGVMGCSLGYAIGSKIANPEKMVISIDGDGSFNMTSSELKTLVEYNIPIKIAIINDSSLQMVKVWEELFFNKRYTATDNNNNPNYVKLAEAYGIDSLYCDNYDDLPIVMNKFLETDKPVLCEFKVEKDICLPLVGPGKALDEMILFDDYHGNKIEPMKGEAPC